jgi:GNAT superfamily N-acetyltransferase
MTAARVRSERADVRHLNALTPLFAAYRRFYGRSEYPRARLFLEERLLRAAVHYASGQGASELMLQTATGDVPAQRLYEREGWIPDHEFYVYNHRLAAPTESGPQE